MDNKKFNINTVFIGGMLLIASFFIASGSIQMKVESAANVFKWYLLIGTFFWTIMAFMMMFGKVNMKFKKKDDKLSFTEKLKLLETTKSKINHRALFLGTGTLIFNELSKIQNVLHFNILVSLAGIFLFFYFYKKKNTNIL